jgi:anti-sigma regulatory factor (Ser/Thr protein kinase)
MSDGPSNPGDGVKAVTVQVPARADALAGLRRTVREYIHSAGGERSIADDLELVTSELATNVIEHTSAPTITLTIERTTEAWVIQVDDVVDPFVLAEVIALPAVSQPTGRGLFVVQSLVDDLEVVETPTSRALRCRRRLSA